MVRRTFAGKSVFITGASSGIGAALAREFGRLGARVALTARRTDWLEQVRNETEAAGGQAIAAACDVTRRESIDEAVAAAVEAFGGIDVAVANAGFGVSGLFTRLSTEDFRRQFEVNFFGLIDTAHAVLPYLEASNGRLGLVSSVLGRLGTPTSGPYAASKFAVCGLAECICYELAERGVSVTLINPGVVESHIRMTDNYGVYHPGRGDPAARMAVPADKAARAIVRALARRQFEAVITGHGKIAVWAARHFPRTLRFIIRNRSRGELERIAEKRRPRADA